MKIFLIAILSLSTLAAHAELVESTRDWTSACDGATIEVVTDRGKIQSVRAFARHSSILREWRILYVQGIPVAAEYREWERGKLKQGDRSGEDSGINPLKKILTFTAIEGKFNVPDQDLAKDLTQVITLAKSSGD
jgi:hypothetical protein